MDLTMTFSKNKKTPYGYLTPDGFEGWVPWFKKYILFATENEYLEYIKEGEK